MVISQQILGSVPEEWLVQQCCASEAGVCILAIPKVPGPGQEDVEVSSTQKVSEPRIKSLE